MQENYIARTPSQMVKKVCDRKVSIARKLERSDGEGQKFFNQMLDSMELDLTIPDFRRESILRNIFPQEIYHKVVTAIPVLKHRDVGLEKILDVKPRRNVSTRTKYSSRTSSEEDITETTVSEKKLDSGSIITSETDSPEKVIPRALVTPSKLSLASLKQSVQDIRAAEITPEKVGSSEAFDSVLVKVLQFRAKPKLTTYYNFFRKCNDDAAIWRTLTTKLIKLKTAEEKSDMIAELIANRFVKWAKENKMSERLSAQDVIDLFTLKDLNKIYVRQEEIYSVPGQVGWHIGHRRRTRQFILADEIIKDKKAFEFPGTHNVAFGKSIPRYLYKGTSSNDNYKEWLQTKFPRELETMEAVFGDIEYLEITQKYASFIAERPYIRPPPYLVQCGLVTYPEGHRHYKTALGRRKQTRRESIYTICEAPKIETLKYEEVRLPVLNEQVY